MYGKRKKGEILYHLQFGMEKCRCLKIGMNLLNQWDLCGKMK